MILFHNITYLKFKCNLFSCDYNYSSLQCRMILQKSFEYDGALVLKKHFL